MVEQDKDFYASLGQRISRARKKLGWTQATLASRINMSRAYVTNLEVGRQPIQVHVLVRIAKELDVRVEHLVCGDTNDDSLDVEAKLGVLDHGSRTWVESIMRE